MSTSLDRVEGFEYKQLDHNIHELCFHESTVATLNACFACLDTIFSGAPPDETLLLLSDIRQSGIPPVAHLWSLARRVMDKHPNRPATCNVVLHNLDSRFARVFMVVMEQLAGLYRARVQFYRGDKQEQALAWLLENREMTRRAQ